MQELFCNMQLLGESAKKDEAKSNICLKRYAEMFKISGGFQEVWKR
jgi:hypothetical protein